MKTQTQLFTTLNNEEMKALTNTVKETLVANCNKKVFTSLDLWNVQRHRKNISIRKFA